MEFFDGLLSNVLYSLVEIKHGLDSAILDDKKRVELKILFGELAGLLALLVETSVDQMTEIYVPMMFSEA